ncbi:UDP-3-O-(3-hydroxymyristoyl)glucosamine N-acyltransferase [Reinekea forsetii]|nr:UDP-3-O-(3-hydroxymyristoyl)glucosamine N-acyltransferase [Reinekea forsetii]
MQLKHLLEALPSPVSVPESAAAIEINEFAPLDKAKPGSISFLASAKYRRLLESSEASAVLLTEKERENCPSSITAIVVDDPYLAYAYLSHQFDFTPKGSGHIHPTAVVSDAAQIGRDVTIEAYAVIEADAEVGDNAHIGAHCVVSEGAKVGDFTRLQHHVTLLHRVEVGTHCLIQSGTVIGSNGFGYAPLPEGKGWQPIAQTGRVIIGHYVEIGANCTIDRGAIEDTVIEDRAIIDNLVHLAHNVTIGRATALAAQIGIAGSTHVGANCSAGGQSGFTGHINIADNSHFTGQAMVTKGTTEAGLYSSGIPAQASGLWRKMVARIRKLDSLFERVDAIEKKLK